MESKTMSCSLLAVLLSLTLSAASASPAGSPVSGRSVSPSDYSAIDRGGGYGYHGHGHGHGYGYGPIGGGGGFGYGPSIGQAYGQYHLPLLTGVAIGALLGYLLTNLLGMDDMLMNGNGDNGGSRELGDDWRFKRDLDGVMRPNTDSFLQNIGMDVSANEIDGDYFISSLNSLWEDYKAEDRCLQCVLLKRMKDRLFSGNGNIEKMLQTIVLKTVTNGQYKQ